MHPISLSASNPPACGQRSGWTHSLHLAATEIGVLDAGGEGADAELAGQSDVATVPGGLLQHALSVDDHARDEALEVIGAHDVAAADRHQRGRVEHVVLVTFGERGQVRRGHDHREVRVLCVFTSDIEDNEKDEQPEELNAPC